VIQRVKRDGDDEADERKFITNNYVGVLKGGKEVRIWKYAAVA
jgi:hypothetical protein